MMRRIKFISFLIIIFLTISFLVFLLRENRVILGQAEGELIWVQNWNPSNDRDRTTGVAVDGTGVYVVGYDYTAPLDARWRIQKRSLTTGVLVWDQSSDPSVHIDEATDVAVDSTGIYVVGIQRAWSAGFARIEKRNLATGALIWTNIDGHDSGPGGVAADSIGVYVGKYLMTPDPLGGKSAVWKMEKRDQVNGALIWEQTHHPFIRGSPLGVAVDSTGVYFVGGEMVGGGYWANYRWRIEKRSLTTGALIWATTSDPFYYPDMANDVVVDSTGIYIVGYETIIPGYPAGPHNTQWRIEKRSLTTGALLWATTSDPSPGSDRAHGVAVDSTGVYVVGYEDSSGGQWRIEKRSLTDGSLIWVRNSNPTPQGDVAHDIARDSTGIYIVGEQFVSSDDMQWRIEKRGLVRNVYGWAWANTPPPGPGDEYKVGLGWISFNCDSPPLPTPRCTQTDYGVNIESDGTLTGYAYFNMNDPNTPAEEIGWIRFDPPGPYPNCPATTCPAGSPNHSARLDVNTRKITGWARACNVFVSGCSGALKPESERGGWDGWILLGPIVREGTDYGVWIDTAVTPAEFRGWAWGADVIGWILFNCKDSPNPNTCNNTRTSGTGTPLDQGFKVWTTFVFPNSPPSALNPRHDDPNPADYCGVTGFPPVRVRWDFSDPDPGDSQSAFQVQVATTSNFAANTIVVDTGKTSGSSQSYLIASGLSWGESYYWRVRVWDKQDATSTWAISSFTTISYPFPFVNFNWHPQVPIIGERIQFCSRYDEARNCTSTPSGGWSDCFAPPCTWNWSFPGDWQYATGSSATSTNPAGTFTTFRQKSVTLTITDARNYTCSRTRTDLNVRRRPIWYPAPP